MSLVIDMLAFAGPDADSTGIRARLKWMDGQGIDIQNLARQNVKGRFGDGALPEGADVRARNDGLAGLCADGHGRLLPVTALEGLAPEEAIAEVARMRRRGSRAVLVPNTPEGGVSMAHPAWDGLWRAVTDNGMAALLHAGFRAMPEEAGRAHRQWLAAVMEGGLFTRHPRLAVVLAGAEVGWLPAFLRDAEAAANVWAAPPVDDDAMALAENLRAVPEDRLLFASGSSEEGGAADPATRCEPVFRELGPRRRQLFMGGAAEALYAAMGDPLRRPRVLAGCGGRAV